MSANHFAGTAPSFEKHRSEERHRSVTTELPKSPRIGRGATPPRVADWAELGPNRFDNRPNAGQFRPRLGRTRLQTFRSISRRAWPKSGPIRPTLRDSDTSTTMWDLVRPCFARGWPHRPEFGQFGRGFDARLFLPSANARICHGMPHPKNLRSAGPVPDHRSGASRSSAPQRAWSRVCQVASQRVCQPREFHGSPLFRWQKQAWQTAIPPGSRCCAWSNRPHPMRPPMYMAYV